MAPAEEVVRLMISVLACNLKLDGDALYPLAGRSCRTIGVPQCAGAAWLLACWRLLTSTMHPISGAGVQHEAAGGAWRQQAALGGGAARSADALLCLVSRSTLHSHVQVPKKPTCLWLNECPGVQSAAEINFMITDRSISVRVPDRYRLVRCLTLDNH